MAGYFWWFGINNKDERKSHGHVNYHPFFEAFLIGNQLFFDWKRNVKKHQEEYDDMRKDDSVLFWMGDGQYPNWGIIGFGFIEQVLRNSSIFRLKTTFVPHNPITPYQTKKPMRTDVTDFLIDTFSPSFKPLGKLFRQISDYKNLNTSNSIAETVASITKDQFISCLDFAKRICK